MKLIKKLPFCNKFLDRPPEITNSSMRRATDRTNPSAESWNEGALAGLRKRFGSLSPRERRIMIEVARGRLSKQIAGDIGISEPTVKVHRSRAMRKMKARTLPEFGGMAAKLKLIPEGKHHS